MFLSLVSFAKSKSKTILVQMVSQAGTGYCFNTKRSRLREKLTLLRYDPLGKIQRSYSTKDLDAFKAFCSISKLMLNIPGSFVAPLTIQHSFSNEQKVLFVEQKKYVLSEQWIENGFDL